MGIYTKTGDKGKTSMFEPDPTKRGRVSKASLRVHAIGAVDELNSYLGVANAHCTTDSTVQFIKSVQRDLFTIGSILAKAPLVLPTERVTVLEDKIDEIDTNLPPLKNFLMPEGSLAAVHFMYARAIARRAERRVVALHKVSELPETVLQFMNRMSDLLFILFRDENRRSGEQEEIWIGKKN
jgi:cob(I)alamin adenosyltransferase